MNRRAFILGVVTLCAPLPQACATPVRVDTAAWRADAERRLHWIVNPRVAPPGEPWTELLK